MTLAGPETENLVYFLWQKFRQEISVVRKLVAFGLKISTFPRVLVVSIPVAYLVAFTIA